MTSLDDMGPPGSDREPAKEDLYQIDDALSELFDIVLDVLTDTDKFGRPTSPSIFIVYAHDNDGKGSAGAQCVRYLIRWLLAIRSRTLSDKSPLRSSREGETAAARNILSNQFCLLPRDTRIGDAEDGITSVDKVILCGSEVLRHYCEHPFTSSYIDAIVACYDEAERRNMQPEDAQSGIRRIVEEKCHSDGFHHVLTELAFLKLRRSARLGDNDGVIPIALSGDGMKYLPFLDNCDLFLKLDPSQCLAHQHKLFFNLLRQLYADSHTHTVIDAFQECYKVASERLREKGAITRAIFREIAYKEIYNAQDTVLQFLKGAIRDEEWRREWRSRTKSALSHRNEILDWLPKFHDITDTHRDNLQQRQGRTGAWILIDKKYEKWKGWNPAGSAESASAQQLKACRLWCHGKPGAGKTIISSVIIEDLENHIVEPSVAIAYVFCKHGEDQTASSLMLSLVAQLAHQRHELSEKLIEVAERYKARIPPMPPNPIECEQMLEAEVCQFKKVFFVVDALDERLNNGHSYCVLNTLLQTKANVLVTSRDIGSIGEFLADADSIEITAQPDDVRAYLNFRFGQMEAFMLRRILKRNPTLQSYIVEALVAKTDGMFLLPRMHVDLLIDAIKRYPTKNTVKTTVDELSSKLDKVYDEYMRRILQGDSAEHASDVLAWVLFARQPVPMKVIQEAISLQRNRNQIDDLIDGCDLLGYCIGLVVEKVPSGATVTFVHPDTERYFRDPATSEKIRTWLPDGPRRIADSCLRCLLLEDTKGPADSPLWSYAAEYWGHHIQDKYAELEPLISEYLSQSDKISLAMRHSMRQPRLMRIEEVSRLSSQSRPRWDIEFSYLCRHPVPSTCHGWHAAAFFGISQHFHAAGQGDIGCRDSNGWTPIWWAILGRQDTTVKLLLKMGAETSTKSYANVPLATWMLGVEKRVVRTYYIDNMIVGKRSRVIIGDMIQLPAEVSYFDLMEILGYRTWQIATEESALEVIKTLHSDGLNARDDSGNTVLMTAAMLWQCNVVHQLKDQGADMSLRNNSGATAFTQALKDRHGYNEVKNVLVSKRGRAMIGLSIFVSPETTVDPYSFGKVEATIEKMLVELIPEDLEANSKEGRQALRLAIINRHSLVVNKLLERGANPNAQYEDGSTPLCLACTPPIVHKWYISNLLLQKRARMHLGTYVTTKEPSSFFEVISTSITASATLGLSHNVAERHEVLPTDFESIIRMLLKNGADVNAEVSGTTALALAAKNEYLTLFRTLLAAGADITRVHADVLERLRGLLRQDAACEGIYGQASLGTLQDFQTHDYCILLLNFAIPQWEYSLEFGRFEEDSGIHLGNIIQFESQVRLDSGEEAGNCPNVQRKWTPRKEYEQRVRGKRDHEPAELLAMIANALSNRMEGLS
ncbi:hypothetical protein VE03_03418 [Pseudogymnoascus sp. 23342-1-I1]|nr:hypothetical protein VE03_03418 [Pseudogymnoascus sp. 23342-1-I1]